MSGTLHVGPEDRRSYENGCCTITARYYPKENQNRTGGRAFVSFDVGREGMIIPVEEFKALLATLGSLSVEMDDDPKDLVTITSVELGFHASPVETCEDNIGMTA